MKRQGAVGNKRKDSRSDMSDFWHKYMDSYGEMMVSSGIKTNADTFDIVLFWWNLESRAN